MIIKTKYESLLESEIFRKWKENNPETYLAHAFAILDNKSDGEWQFGYYNFTSGLMTSFFMKEEGITYSPETEVFKKEETTVSELYMEDIKIDFKEALSIVDTLIRQKYSSEQPAKNIVLLQAIDIGAIWNISIMTLHFNVLNVKIDAGDGRILEDKLVSAMDFSSRIIKGERKAD